MEQKEKNKIVIKCFMDKMEAMMKAVPPESKEEYERMYELMEHAKMLCFEDPSIHTFNLNYFF